MSRHAHIKFAVFIARLLNKNPQRNAGRIAIWNFLNAQIRTSAREEGVSRHNGGSMEGSCNVTYGGVKGGPQLGPLVSLSDNWLAELVTALLGHSTAAFRPGIPLITNIPQDFRGKLSPKTTRFEGSFFS